MTPAPEPLYPLEEESLLAGDYFRLIAAVAFGGSLAIGFTACPGEAAKPRPEPEKSALPAPALAGAAHDPAEALRDEDRL